MIKSVLFVCLGNICRSPLAYGIAKNYIEKSSLDIVVDSAGTSSFHIGETPCIKSIEIAKDNGVDISKHYARQVCKDDFDKFDLIVALDRNNYKDLKAKSSKANIVKLGDFGLQGACIPDPYYFTQKSEFQEVYKMIELCVKNLLDSIKVPS